MAQAKQRTREFTDAEMDRLVQFVDILIKIDQKTTAKKIS